MSNGAGDPPATGPAAAAIAEYVPGLSVALSDDERWPTLSRAGRARLEALRTHPHAPVWVHECGDRLLPADHETLATLAEDLAVGAHLPRSPVLAVGGPPAAGHAPVPDWVPGLLERVQRTVPHYRALVRRTGRPVHRLEDMAPVGRADLMRSVAAFVPVDVPLDRVMEGSSSGSTGAALIVPLHPVSTAAEVVLFTHLAATVGVDWQPDADRLAVVNLVDQRAAFTYASALTAKGGAPMARVNLHPGAWRDLAHRTTFLEQADPQVLSSSPLPLLALADLDIDLAPLVVFSGAAHLAPAARERVASRWGAPVVDVYGTREAGLVAADTTGGRETSEHVVLPRRVHVEILDGGGVPVEDGTRGEVVVTVDDNPYLPLVRYRTGDQAALRRERRPDGTWTTTLLGLEGRAAVRFRSAAGTWVPSVDATQVLQASGLPAWHLHQAADGSLRLSAPPQGGRTVAFTAAAALRDLLGHSVEVTVGSALRDLDTVSKRRFSSDLTP